MELKLLPDVFRFAPPPPPPSAPIDCRGNSTDARPRRIAVVDGAFCGSEPSSKEGCYLLSDDALLDSYGALECLGIAREKGTNLPAFSVWGFLHPDCWSYVSVRHFKRPWLLPSLISGKEEAAHMRRLATSAAQEWAHPSLGSDRVSKPLRVVVRGRCLPFLRAGYLNVLSRGMMRRDTHTSTVYEGSTQRRAVFVERVVVDYATSPVLAQIRAHHAGALNPVVQQAGEVSPPNNDYITAERARSLTIWRLIAVNLVVVAVNFVIAARGFYIWDFLSRKRVMEWIQMAQPHVGVTLRTMRVLDWLTRPVRWPFARVAGLFERGLGRLFARRV
ncbi:hypothetical protein AB1Y20_009544 [Prymnesium parvum]|uniref:Uncharacterized protein n=1 Tax=Prymnesium parvum TaxID=97485 RepID=A0AB34K2G1_PRYPA